MPNEHIDFHSTPFYVPATLRDWPEHSGRQRRAAISSFGFSGTNAHLVLEEWVGNSQTASALPADPAWSLASLSARTPQALAERAAGLLSWLEESGSACSLHQVAYTLNARRSHLSARAAWLFRSRAECVEGLRALRDGSSSNPLVFSSSAATRAVDADQEATRCPSLTEILERGRRDPETIRTTLQDMARLYLAGKDLDWLGFYGALRAAPVSLPSYPFAREYHRLPVLGTTDSNGKLPPEAALGHSGAGLRWSQPVAPPACSRLDPADPLVRDHLAGGRLIASAALLIELVRATAGRRLAPRRVASLRRIFWHTPLVLEDKAVETGVRFGPNGSLTFELMSRGTTGWGVHIEGDYAATADDGGDELSPINMISMDRATIAERCPDLWTRDQVYETFARSGWHYGPAYRTIQELRVGQHEVLAELAVPSLFLPKQVAESELFPPLLDGALQAAVGLCAETVRQGGCYFPVSLEKLESSEPLIGNAWARVQTSAGCADGGSVRKFDVAIARPDGRVVVQIKGFTLRLAPDPVSPKCVAKPARTALLRGVFHKVRQRKLSPVEARRMLKTLLE